MWLALITGLTTGGISCLAVQGGLLAASQAQTGTNSDTRIFRIKSTTAFLISKLFAYTVLGILLGILGSKVLITPILQGWIQILVGIFLLGTAGRLLNLHPLFRYFTITPPKFLFRMVRNASKNTHLLSSSFLGFMTILIPCGVTQAMMVLALSSGNAAIGGGIMAAFILGTSPIFFLLGLTASEFFKRGKLAYVGTAVIVALGILSINTGQGLRGSVHTIQNYYNAATGKLNEVSTNTGKVAGVNKEGKQEATIKITNNGYSSSVSTLKVGVPVKLNLQSANAQGCSRAFTIPSLNLSKILPVNGSDTLEFTPTETGRLTYTCSMGMYTGYFEVI